MSVFRVALERSRSDRNLAAVTEVLRSGYAPTDEEWDEFAGTALNGGRRPDPAKYERDLYLATAKILYHARRAQDDTEDEAITAMLKEFDTRERPMSEQTARDVARGNRPDVNRIFKTLANSDP